MKHNVDLRCGDCLDILKSMDDDSVDLTITSPPYGSQRSYGIGFAKSDDEWVDWSAERFMECLRVTKGAVCWVVAGYTKNYKHSPLPEKLMVELENRGAILRRSLIYHRVGIPGSGGSDWFRADTETVVCATRTRGKLPWSDNTAMGEPPKYPISPTSFVSHRKKGKMITTTSGYENGDVRVARKIYVSPKKANPGNVIRCNAGKNHMGDDFAHENEAPFPEKLPEWFVKSLCPPGGIVLDPFLGSGTTAKVSIMNGRKCIGIDVRQSQINLTYRRLDAAGCFTKEII